MEVNKNSSDGATNREETNVDQNTRRPPDPTYKETLRQRDLTTKSESEKHANHMPRIDTIDRSSEFGKSVHYNSESNTMDKEMCDSNRPISSHYDPINRQRLHSDNSERQLNNSCSVNRHNVPNNDCSIDRHNVPFNYHNIPVSENDIINKKSNESDTIIRQSNQSETINRHSGENDTINRQSNQSDTINRHSDENDTINRPLNDGATSKRPECEWTSRHLDQTDTNQRQCDVISNSLANDNNRCVFQSDFEKCSDTSKSSLDHSGINKSSSEKVSIKSTPISSSDIVPYPTANNESIDAPRIAEDKPAVYDLSVKSFENTDNGNTKDKMDKFEEQSLRLPLNAELSKEQHQSVSTSSHLHPNMTSTNSYSYKEKQNMSIEKSMPNSPTIHPSFSNKKVLVDQSTQTNSTGAIITLNQLSTEDSSVQASVIQLDTETQTMKSGRGVISASKDKTIRNTIVKRQSSELKKRHHGKRKHRRRIQLKQDDDAADDDDGTPSKRTRNHLSRSSKPPAFQVLPDPEFEEESDNHDLVDKISSDDDPEMDEKTSLKQKPCAIQKQDSAEKIALRAKKPFKCPFCHKRFIKETSLENHTLNSCTKNRRGTDFICSECGDHFPLFSVYRKHLKSHVGEFYKCVCGEKFENYLSLKGHIEGEVKSSESSKHDEVHPYSCSICLKTFIHQGRFKRHMITHENNSKIACSVCGKEFEKGYMEIHERVHTGHKPFACQHPDCNMSYTSKKLLQRHERIHVKKYQLPCPHCDKVFTQTSRLKDHLRVHTGEKPYICEICGIAFSRTNHLNRHKLLHMKQQALPRMMVPNIHVNEFSKLNPACR